MGKCQQGVGMDGRREREQMKTHNVRSRLEQQSEPLPEMEVGWMSLALIAQFITQTMERSMKENNGPQPQLEKKDPSKNIACDRKKQHSHVVV